MTPLLMIPGPIEVSPAVIEAAAKAPVSHVSPQCIAAFGRSLRAMRDIWRAPEGSLPVILPGSGTLAMELGVWNCASPGDRALVVDTGFFSERLATMLERRGVVVDKLTAPLGQAPSAGEVASALQNQDYRIVTVTHVDTSTGVRADAGAIARVAKQAGAVVLVDGVCATVGEQLDMASSGVDVYLTASQKAVGAPPGLAMAVFSPDALQAHAQLSAPPPMGLDVASWRPIMEAYEAGRPSYFGTPATTLIAAVDVALQEILAMKEGELRGVEAAWARHAWVATDMRRAWASMGLEMLPASEGVAANTLSAVKYPKGVGPDLVGRIKANGVIVAGGLHPKLKTTYFRVGHMGWVTSQPHLLSRTITAVRNAL